MIDLLNYLTKDRNLPEGCTGWGIRSVYPDLTSRNDFRWQYPGNWTVAPGPIVTSNSSSCPKKEGDGICLAFTWAGMASRGIPASTILLCAYATNDVLGKDENKLRLSRAFVVDIIDGYKLVKDQGARANLQGANLQGADLGSANLRGVDLRLAKLQGAYLQWADLQGANLQRANLQGADLKGANLQGADLRLADLRGVDLQWADLQGAYLRLADLRGANLEMVLWPEGFTPPTT